MARLADYFTYFTYCLVLVKVYVNYFRKVLAKVEALTGPMTPPGKRVQTINPPGSEVGPGAAGAVATWEKAVEDEVDAMGFKWERKGRSSKHFPFDWSGL